MDEANSMNDITAHGRQAVAEIARRHGVSEDAAMTLLHALQRGHGTAAQFSHPELGGMGQWSSGGMTQVGDMFNDGLKQTVRSMCTELAALLDSRTVFSEANAPQDHNPDDACPGHAPRQSWWPGDLGSPSSTGGQNDMQYALFPGTHRLAVAIGGNVSVYDTGDHQITGFAQAQSGSSGQALRFSSQHGQIGTDQLRKLG